MTHSALSRVDIVRYGKVGDRIVPDANGPLVKWHEVKSLFEQLETQVGLIRDLASELASVSDIAAAPDGDYERWLRELLARADAAVGEPGV